MLVEDVKLFTCLSSILYLSLLPTYTCQYVKVCPELVPLHQCIIDATTPEKVYSIPHVVHFLLMVIAVSCLWQSHCYL